MVGRHGRRRLLFLEERVTKMSFTASSPTFPVTVEASGVSAGLLLAVASTAPCGICTVVAHSIPSSACRSQPCTDVALS